MAVLASQMWRESSNIGGWNVGDTGCYPHARFYMTGESDPDEVGEMFGAREGPLSLRGPDEPEQIGHRARTQGCGPEATYIWIRRSAPVARAGQEVRLNV